jgi:8-oxo-dGTP pyrophosphatase MutT (NUDIX family)
MLKGTSDTRTIRTVLEQKIRERRQTFEEFAEYAETYAREHAEPGTLSVRHLQRLVAGRQPDGTPLPPPRPATVRLLERIFGLSIDELLESPTRRGPVTVGQLLRVAVAVVVRGSQVLLVCRRNEDGGGAGWQFPAGVVKPGQSHDTVAVRETLAETDVHATVIRDLGNRLHPITSVHCVYLLCDYLSGEARNIDVVENVSVVWVEIAEMTRYIPVEHIYEPARDALATAQLSRAPAET